MKNKKGIFLGIESTTKSDVLINNDSVFVQGGCKTGKTAGVIIPTLRNYNGSAIVIDKNGEIYREILPYIDEKKTSGYQFWLPGESVNLAIFIKETLPDLLNTNHRFILDISFESYCTGDEIGGDIENLFKTAISLRNTTFINENTDNLLFCIDEYPKGNKGSYNLNFIFNEIHILKEKCIQPLFILQNVNQIEFLYGDPCDFLNKFDYILIYYSNYGFLFYFWENMELMKTFFSKMISEKHIKEIETKLDNQCFLINTGDTSKNCFITKKLYFIHERPWYIKITKKLSTLIGGLG